MKCRFFLLLLLFFLTALVFADSNTLVATSHSGTINAIGRDRLHSYIFTAGEDGTVRIWDSRTRNMVEYIRVSSLPLHMIAVNPVRPEIAVLEEDPVRGFVLSVWNWELKEPVFTHVVDEKPLRLQFSPRGTYLVFSRPDWNSLTFLDTASGRRVPLLADGFGIVTDFLISKSEQTILTYNPAGTLQYRDIESGTLKNSVSTEPNLKFTSLNSSGRYMSGYREGLLEVIDLVTGKIQGRTAVEGVYKTVFEESSNTILTVAQQDESTTMETFFFRGAGFNLTRRRSVTLTGTVTDAVYAGNVFLALFGEGTPYQSGVSLGSTYSFAAADLEELQDMAFLEDFAAITSTDTIYLFQSPFFGSSASGRPEFQFSKSELDNPFSGLPGITRSMTDSFILFQRGGEEEGYYMFLDPFSVSLGDLYTTQFPLIDVSGSEGRLLFIESNGRMTVKDAASLETQFTYTAFGVQTAVLAGNDRMVAGKSKINSMDSSLLEVNTRTRETVLIESGNLYTYDLVYDPVSSQVFSIGIERFGTRLRTLLKSHSGTHFEYERTIITSNTEDVSASIAIDPYSSRIYTSLGYSSIRQYRVFGVSSLAYSERIPRRLKVHNDFLYAMNRDSSISVWNRLSGNKVMDFFVLKNGDWIAHFEDGSFTASPGGRKFIVQRIAGSDQGDS